jgi:chromatin structure-remodeling complex subunit SFH1
MNASDYGINPSLPAYTSPGPTLPSKLQDVFLWNLHETLITPDQFAIGLVHDLDLPNQTVLSNQISNQIRLQLEEYAGVALHPLFHSVSSTQPQTTQVQPKEAPATPGPILTNLINKDAPTNGSTTASISASGSLIQSSDADAMNPDDTYRCIINLNINLLNKVLTDKFEWSLLHPPGFAEIFAKQTCADLGLSGEWVPAMTHAIYETVLRLKKEACERGGLVGGLNGTSDIDNMALEGQEAGWRFDNEQLADEWEPSIEVLSKEEISRRESDKARDMRSSRRGAAKFSSNSGLIGGMPQDQPGYFDLPDLDTPLGRGERSKKRRRTDYYGRSGTPGGRDTPEVAQAGYGGGQALSDA